MTIPLVDLQAQYEGIRGEIDKAIAAVLEKGDFILGGAVNRFEEAFASYCGARHGVGVASGTEALHLALVARGIGQGDEVITAANTYVATVLAILYCGARPVLVDVDPGTANMDPALVRKAITKKTRAIMPVHLYGQMADMASIMAIAKEHGIPVIEDACQAHGADEAGRRAGASGIMGCFSFYPGKNLGAYGDGGMVITSDNAIADRLRMLRNYGQRRKYEHEIVGYNSRLDTIQAAILEVKLRHLEEWNRLRREHAARCDELLKDSRVELFRPRPNCTHVYHLYVIRVKERDALANFLKERGISTGIHYPQPIHLTECFRNLGYPQGSFPVSERFSNEILSLPMYPELDEGLLTRIAGAVHDGLSRAD